MIACELDEGIRSLLCLCQLLAFWCSVREVEVIVGVSIVLTLTNERANGVEGKRQEGNATPHTETEVNNPSLDDESLDTTVHEVEQPLLSGVRSVVPDVTTAVA